jgi:hypothetical protein
MAFLKREAPGGSPAFRGHAEVESLLRNVPPLGTESTGATVAALAARGDRSIFGARFREGVQP